MTTTLQTKIKDPDCYPILDEVGKLYGFIERRLYQDLMKKRPSQKKVLKKRYISKYKIPARLFNSLWVDVSGAIDSQKELVTERKSYIKRKVQEVREG